MPTLKGDNYIGDQSGAYQPKMKHQGYVRFAEPNNIAECAIKSTGLPKGSFNNIEVPFVNLKYNFPGKWTGDTIEMTLFDFAGDNTTKKIYTGWKSGIFNPETGKMGYGTVLKQTVTITLMAPDGTIIEEWYLIGAYPENVNGGDGLDWSDDNPREISVTGRYDRAEYKEVKSDGTVGIDVDLSTEG